MASQVDGADVMLGDLVGAVATSKLHGDLMIQIFARLPVKSILRFKTVRRAWHALFNNPAFIRHHCDIVRSSAEKIYMLSFLVHISRSCFRHKGDEIFSLLLEHSGGNPITKSLKIPFEGNFTYFLVVGSINGLVCLNVAKYFTSFLLWNPAIKKHCHIRKPQLVVGEHDHVSAGFAYDQKTDSYKIIRISYANDAQNRVSTVARVEIYSTGTDTWKTKEIVGFPFLSELHEYNKGGVVISGDLYWFSPLEENFEKLVWFDASTEDFRIYNVPHDDGDCDWDHVLLEAMGEDLAVVDKKFYASSGSDSDSDSVPVLCISRVDIRKLIKYDNGGEDPFHVEKLTIELGHGVADIAGVGRNGEIIAYGPYGDCKTLLLCDEEENKHLVRYGEGFSYVYYYNESLVWPSSLA